MCGEEKGDLPPDTQNGRDRRSRSRGGVIEAGREVEEFTREVARATWVRDDRCEPLE
jgi:hypothetical protein